MENTLSIFVEALNETWEMGDDMAMKLNEYYKDNLLNATNADEVHRQWWATLTPDEQAKISRHTPQE